MPTTHKMQRRSLLLAALAAAAPRAQAADAPAAGWPVQPVKLMVGFPGGSSPDLTARALAEPLAAALGQPVIVENKPGAGGNIAAAQVARAADGHTLGIAINGNLTTAPLLYRKLASNPAKDLAPISLLTTAPAVLVAPAGLPGGKEFLQKARQEGERWNYGSVGAGSIAHLGVELIKARLPGFNPLHVPYNGQPAVITALIGGQIQMGLMAPGVAMPHVAEGRLRAIGLTTASRSPLAPGVPALAELGVPDYDLQVWNALIAPAGLPAAARQKLAQAVAAVMQAQPLRQRLLALGWQPVGSSPEELRQHIGKEAEALGQIVRTLGLRLD